MIYLIQAVSIHHLQQETTYHYHCQYYKHPVIDTFYGQSNIALPIINAIETFAESEIFFPTFDQTIERLNEKEKKNLFQMAANGSFSSGKAHSYIVKHAVTSADIFRTCVWTKVEEYI